MFDVGGWLIGLFGTSSWAVVLCVFLVFLIDALIFPAFPELFFLAGFMYDPTISFGLELLVAAVIAEIIGITSLYWVVEHIRVPERIRRIADKYVKFLIVSDERMLLVNRVAPMVPFAGAFISLIDDWKLSKALFYVILGCVVKYGLLMLMSNFFYSYLGSDLGQTLTFVLVFAIIIISFIAAYIKKKRSGLDDKEVNNENN